jgi:hypothetical protein
VVSAAWGSSDTICANSQKTNLAPTLILLGPFLYGRAPVESRAARAGQNGQMSGCVRLSGMRAAHVFLTPSDD